MSKVREPIITGIKVGMGATINTGNYSNMRPEVHVEITLPDKPTPEEIAEGFKMAWAEVEEQMNKAIEAVA